MTLNLTVDRVTLHQVYNIVVRWKNTSEQGNLFNEVQYNSSKLPSSYLIDSLQLFVKFWQSSFTFILSLNLSWSKLPGSSFFNFSIKEWWLNYRYGGRVMLFVSLWLFIINIYANCKASKIIPQSISFIFSPLFRTEKMSIILNRDMWDAIWLKPAVLKGSTLSGIMDQDAS